MNDFSELNRLAADLGKVPGRTVKRANQALRKAAADVESNAKIIAPVDTGNLRNSISSTVTGLTAEVGPTANYGQYLEYGTSRMAPRAYMGPSLDRVTPGFMAAMEKLGGDVL